MKTVPAWVRSMFLVAIGTMIAIPAVDAAGGKGKKWGGGNANAAAQSRSNQQFRSNAVPSQSQRSYNAANAAASGQVRTPSNYGYGSGRGRSYGATQRGRSNRGSSYGNRYATSNQGIRSMVIQLRRTNSTLARLNSDYHGHRVQAMRSINQAIRHLSHSGTSSYGMNTSNGMGMRNNANGVGLQNNANGVGLQNNANGVGLQNNANGVGLQNNANGVGLQNNANGVGLQNRAGAGANRTQTMSQAQSDNHVQRALRTLQGVNMRLTSQGSTSSHARARGAVQRAMRELNVALRVR
jgi:hypothetical protein